MVKKKKAYLLYLPPYSPDFNPIEKMLHVYKSTLKRLSNTRSMSEDDKHFAALNSVTPEIAANEFLHCQVPRGDFVTDSGTK